MHELVEPSVVTDEQQRAAKRAQRKQQVARGQQERRAHGRELGGIVGDELAKRSGQRMDVRAHAPQDGLRKHPYQDKAR